MLILRFFAIWENTFISTKIFTRIFFFICLFLFFTLATGAAREISYFTRAISMDGTLKCWKNHVIFE